MEKHLYKMLIIAFLGMALVVGSSKASQDDLIFTADDNHEFDLLIFTQQWPVTTCIEWMETSKAHTCLLPSPKEIWTIHGVWPTRFGTIGPAFCNRTATFDPEQLKPYMDQLQQFWINIEKGQSLWQHEWLKHGTCAAVLPELSNEKKYFGKGLSWLHMYSMSSILDEAKILPDQAHQLIDIHAAVVNKLNKQPSIHCIRDRRTGQEYLSEIRICFDKQLQLVDCDNVKFMSETSFRQDFADGINSNCPRSSPILYPNVVPIERLPERTPNPTWQFPAVEIYKILDYIKWLTL